MSKQEFWTHWVIGITAAAVWFWGDKAGIPPQAQALAAVIVPSLIAHALGKNGQPFRPADSSAIPAAVAAPQQPSQPE